LPRQVYDRNQHQRKELAKKTWGAIGEPNHDSVRFFKLIQLLKAEAIAFVLSVAMFAGGGELFAVKLRHRQRVFTASSRL